MFGDIGRYVFGFKKYAEECELLDAFKQLEDTCIEWRHERRPHSPIDEAAIILAPPKLVFLNN